MCARVSVCKKRFLSRRQEIISSDSSVARPLSANTSAITIDLPVVANKREFTPLNEWLVLLAWNGQQKKEVASHTTGDECRNRRPRLAAAVKVG